MRVLGVSLIVCAAAVAGIVVARWQPARLVTVRESVSQVPLPTPEQSSPARLVFVGDIQLSRAVGELMAHRDDWKWPFAEIASVTGGAEVAFGNLESMISDRGATGGCTYCFRADPRVVEGLTLAGFDVLSVANNHAWDHGEEAFTDTIVHLTAGGIMPVGGGRSLAAARQPIVLRAGTTSVAYLAFTDLLYSSACAADNRAGANCADATRMAEDVSAATTMADIVVVSFHSGTEYEPLHDANQEWWYRAAVDAGADLVIGHHPHVVQDSERYGDGIIFYSLGNFIFDQGWSAPTMRGLLVDVTVDDGAITGVATRSVDISSQFQASLR